MPKKFQQLAITKLDNFVFGHSPFPVQLKNGLTIGAGEVYPEINFTLPGMGINADTLPEVRNQYSQMIGEITKRAVELHATGFSVEFELLPDLTLNPEWGAEITKILREKLDEIEQKEHIKTCLRVTPNDIREFARPPLMRHGKYVDDMFRCFDLCAQAGADLLAIESTGGKEIHDEAIIKGDLNLSVFALGILGSRDMNFLWEKVVSISRKYDIIPSGDSACGFGNTAMVLAEQHFIPRIWAALIRVMTVPRSLVAFEQGALGPNKDCAYEGVYIKAITGAPIALEGAEAACAHLSQIGNIAKAVPDLWSNESVQNTKLLSANAPTVSMEQLIYATRLMNGATAKGKESALALRDLFIDSDSALDVQAYVLRPDVVLNLSKQIIAEPTAYLRTRTAVLATLDCFRKALDTGAITLSRVELRWLDNLSKQADSLPLSEEEFIEQMRPSLDMAKVNLSEYEL
ncbi:MAG: methanol--corrinoid methyltransferase [Anaerolineaceae bacterium]|jgi:methanol--5-hydroxybenzimidazolylcobamide Co-methyltransferase|nr:MAG: methanol--corrinoid methyltransferase [Anaerolineaceae bacterium]